MNFYAYFHHFLTNLHVIQYAGSPNNAVNMEFCAIWVKLCKRGSVYNGYDYLSVSQKSPQGRLDFSCGCKLNCIHTCTVKSYGIFQVKNTWVKFV
jgi:hypothetical protein